MIRRVVLSVALLAGLVAGGAAHASAPRCDTRVLVLSAMPVELGPLVAATSGRTTVTYDGRQFWAVSGAKELVLLKTTDSEFHGFVQDRYTTLPPTRDRAARCCSLLAPKAPGAAIPPGTARG